MSNAVTTALAEVRDTIPEEILEYAYVPSRLNFVNSESMIEQEIYRTVIDSRVRRKIDNSSPTQQEILMKDSWKETVDPHSFFINVPLESTKNRRIVSVMSVGTVKVPHGSASSFASIYNLDNRNNQSGSLLHQANKAVIASDSVQVFSTAEVEIVGKNRLLVKSPLKSISHCMLIVSLATDEFFTALIPQLHEDFAEVVVAAVKANIYKKCRIKLSTGKLILGKENNDYKEIVDEYSSAEEEFKELFKEFVRAIMVNDPTRRRRNNQLKHGG